MHVAVLPVGEMPERFLRRTLYEEDFVIAMRAGHPFADNSGIEAYGARRRLVVAQAGDTAGFVATDLAGHGLSRRIALTVPNFMFALAVLSETDLVAALPRRFVAMHAHRFGVIAVEAPVELPRFLISAVVPKVAMMDAGIAWLVGQLEQAGQAA